MKNILGIDYGSSKVGLALGDSETKLASPFKVIAPADLFLEIERLIEHRGLDLAVMGLPLGLNSQETEQTKEVRQFAAELAEKISIPLVFEDERFSTAQAKKEGKASPTKREARSGDDAVAAMYILQSYLDRTYGFGNS
ncbi:MAG: Holliday junction resolvase RuvX [Candidatus Komeilibacteria bacterium]|nr:Holliday junction resolvase RuvX [Candidatus Komeilibacteria bacterium]